MLTAGFVILVIAVGFLIYTVTQQQQPDNEA